MNTEILKRISKALITDNTTVTTSFCVEDTLQPTDINVTIDGIGNLAFPLTTQKIQELITVSSKAKFGLRDKTLLDDNVRSTQEIPLDKIHVAFNKNKLSTLLQETRRALGLGEHVEFVPHLHSMLVYSPGQFFKKHKDSEKMDGMVATLIVVLPSSHIGGDLIVEHNDEEYTFSSENIEGSAVKCFAFYADCEHEVKKVTQGYRVALTYNLIISAKNTPEKLQINVELTKQIKDYFSGLQENRRGDPLKLAYFLDHSYSEHGLRWNLLKGTDHKNAQAFYAAAQELDLTVHLALVEIHESWDLYGDPDDEDPELGDLIDDDVTLSYWVNAANKKTGFNDCGITKEEICTTKETDEFEPYNSEHEGYMGNYGNTMDYWYRRAAIVLWKKDQDIPMEFKLNREQAMQKAAMLTEKPGQEQKLIEIIEKAGKYLYGSLLYNRYEISPLFSLFVRVALYVKDKEKAFTLLNQFVLQQLTDDAFVSYILDLQHLYGTNWCLALLEAWKSKTQSYGQFVIPNIEALVHKLITAGSDSQLMAYLLNYQIKTLISNDKKVQGDKPAIRNKSLQNRMEAMRDTIQACLTASIVTTLDELIYHVMTHPELYSEIDLAKLYFSFDKKITAQPLNAYIKILRDFLVTTIDQKCQEQVPFPDDWTIKVNLLCKCQHCKIVTEFLRAKDDKKARWPLVEAARQHIMQSLDGLELPIDISIEKNSRPYKLVVVKNDSLHKKAQERYAALLSYRRKLQSTNDAA